MTNNKGSEHEVSGIRVLIVLFYFRYLRSNRHDNTLIVSTLIIFYSNYCSFQRKNNSTDLLLFSFPVQNLSGRFESS